MAKKYNSIDRPQMLGIALVVCSPVLFFYSSLGNMATNLIQIDRLPLPGRELFFTLGFSTVTSCISLSLGSMIAYSLLSSKYSLKALRFVVFTPHLAFAYLIYLFLSSGGLIPRVLYPLSIGDPTTSDWGTGVFIHYLLKEIPFVVLFLLSLRETRTQQLLFVGEDLGLSKWEGFRKLYLPLLAKELMVIFILIFTYVMSSFEAPQLLSGNQRLFLPLVIFDDWQSFNELRNIRAQANTLYLFMANLLMCALLYRLSRRR